MKGNPAIFCGRTNLKELGALFEKSDFVISGDTGPMHIARAMKASVIALFGPTSPDLTGPVGDGNYRVLRKDVGCEIPCYDLTCTEARCMKAITPDDVVKVFRNMHEAHSKKNISRNTQ